MNLPPSLPRLPTLRRKPGLPEVEALMEALPGAALLVDNQSQSIALANAKAAELTAYTRAELAGMRLALLFASPDDAASWEHPDDSSAPLGLTLVRRNRNRLAVQAKRVDFNNGGRWSLLTLEPEEEVRRLETKKQRRKKMIASMESLSQAFSQPVLEDALEHMLHAVKEITGASVVSVYLQQLQGNHPRPEVIRFAHTGPPEPLPAQLALADLAALRSPHHWTAGKRPVSALHRAARSAGLTFVASAPLGSANAMLGLIAIAGAETASTETLLPNLKLLAETTSSLIEIHTRTQNIKASLENEQQSASLYRLVEDSINDGLALLSPDLHVLRINAATERMFGYLQDEARGRPVDHILISQGGLESILQLALQGVPTLKTDNLRFYRRSGQPFRALVSVLPAAPSGNLTGLVVLIQDQSEQDQIQVQAQLLEQRALLGEVTSIFAHEVRNPINNISTGLQVMALSLEPDDPNQEMIGRLQQDCDRLSELMKSVLAFSRPTEYEMEAVDLGMLITRLVDRQRPRMTRARVESKIQIENGTPPVRGNPRALEQVFANLITNAIQAMSETGGTVAVRIQPVAGSADRRFVRVEVADNGPGIPKELLDRLFQPFFTTKSDGTGLGLPITKRIITAHKGNIQVSSFPGGTVFQVVLPAMEAE